MKKFYRVIVAYNPLENKITEFRRLDMYSDTYETDSTEMFYKVLGLIDRTSDIILGKTINNNFISYHQPHTEHISKKMRLQ